MVNKWQYVLLCVFLNKIIGVRKVWMIDINLFIHTQKILKLPNLVNRLK